MRVFEKPTKQALSSFNQMLVRGKETDRWEPQKKERRLLQFSAGAGVMEAGTGGDSFLAVNLTSGTERRCGREIVWPVLSKLACWEYGL